MLFRQLIQVKLGLGQLSGQVAQGSLLFRGLQLQVFVFVDEDGVALGTKK